MRRLIVAALFRLSTATEFVWHSRPWLWLAWQSPISDRHDWAYPFANLAFALDERWRTGEVTYYDPPTNPTRELDDLEWAEARDRICRWCLGVDAAEFVARFRAGEYNHDDPDAPPLLMEVLAYFPELD